MSKKNDFPILSAILMVASLLLSPLVEAQLCFTDNTPETISLANFDLVTVPGEIHDTHNNLIWRRCLYGQQWDAANESCSATPIKLDWKTALQTAQNEGWRLPNIKELMSIIDYQCFAPPLQPILFPQAPAALNSGLWTSTPLQTNLNSTDVGVAAWLVDLGHGKLRHQNTALLNYVIFVKNP